MHETPRRCPRTCQGSSAHAHATPECWFCSALAFTKRLFYSRVLSFLACLKIQQCSISFGHPQCTGLLPTLRQRDVVFAAITTRTTLTNDRRDRPSSHPPTGAALPRGSGCGNWPGCGMRTPLRPKCAAIVHSSREGPSCHRYAQGYCGKDRRLSTEFDIPILCPPSFEIKIKSACDFLCDMCPI